MNFRHRMGPRAAAGVLGGVFAAILAGFPGVVVSAEALDGGIERYRVTLVADVGHALAGARALREGAAAGDAAAAKRSWLDARVGWERSEVFTTPFAPELDRAIDAWPDGAAGFHAIEARLFGAGRTDFVPEADRLVHDLSELKTRAETVALTPQGVLEGVVRLVYEVGESKIDGGESRVSGTSLADMRNNVDGIDAAWGTVFAAPVSERDPALAEAVRRGIDGLKALVAARDLKSIDPERLRGATEGLVLRLQSAAPLIGLRKPTLEADAR